MVQVLDRRETGKGKSPRASRAVKARRGTRGRGRGTGDAAPRANIYDEVTERIIAELEAGTVPWVKPWSRVAAGGPGLPVNASTGRAYSGINILILWGAVIAADYPSQGWLTFRQALDAGGSVRKGERGTCIVYADRFVPRDPKGALRGSDPGDRAEKVRAADSGDDARVVPFLKRFTVFNVAQCDGLPERFTAAPPPVPTARTIPAAERVIAASGVDYRLGGDRACYSPDLDFVAMPPQPAFSDALDYYRVFLHELTHATGHPARLGRNLRNGFGTKDYAREELIAEMGSAFLCAALGIVPTLRHADYLASWLAVLREDNRAIVRAASAASKAADWLLCQPGARDDAEAGAA
jgi:antirestriction protein ArdC